MEVESGITGKSLNRTMLELKSTRFLVPTVLSARSQSYHVGIEMTQAGSHVFGIHHSQSYHVGIEISENRFLSAE